jgi:hypothetical protein
MPSWVWRQVSYNKGGYNGLILGGETQFTFFGNQTAMEQFILMNLLRNMSLSANQFCGLK